MSSQTWLPLLALSLLLGSGLVSGIFFAFSTFIMKALQRVTPSAGMASMQSINQVVLNPWFLGVFFGTAALALSAIILAIGVAAPKDSVWLLLGAGLYLLGCLLVTIIVHVPANEALAKIDQQTPDWQMLWDQYLTRWTAWNHVRTAASFLASVALGVFLWKSSLGAPTAGG